MTAFATKAKNSTVLAFVQYSLLYIVFKASSHCMCEFLITVYYSVSIETRKQVEGGNANSYFRK